MRSTFALIVEQAYKKAGHTVRNVEHRLDHECILIEDFKQALSILYIAEINYGCNLDINTLVTKEKE
jgi:cell fate (sporulation/competence/biofilm development) regulator YmcA (YheA/YmcA/DUF963 family)